MKALILVDLQNDFCSVGSLAVRGGDLVVPVANRTQPCFDLVVATQDWHPSDHGSFATNHPGKAPGDVIELDGLQQVLWPTHCVQGCPGADFHGDLDRRRIDKVFSKGTDPRIDSYSGFFDNGHRKPSGLGEYLKEKGISDVYVLGLATDYCVKFTALDAVDMGFQTYLVEDGCRGVNLNPGDAQRAVEEMKRCGVHVVQSSELLVEL